MGCSGVPEVIKRIIEPELFFGIVAPIGAEVEPTINILARNLKEFGYRVVVIKITDIFPKLYKIFSSEMAALDPPLELKYSPLEDRYKTYIRFGDALRAKFHDDALLAHVAVAQIADARGQLMKTNKQDTPEKIAYIIRQFKRKEEIDILRLVYGKLFFQISVYSQRSIRVDNLARKISNSHNFADSNRFRDEAESLVQIDEKEIKNDHGQRVGEIFHEADFIVSADIPSHPPNKQISRFLDLVFGSNSISPTKMEYGMYMAKSASLRTIDLSRQVGAAIFSENSEIISFGTNEVPKAGGGTYWEDDTHDDRDYKRGQDSNDKRKREILSELMNMFDKTIDTQSFDKSGLISKSQFMDALEYGRIIHAEMSAITDSARLGRSLKNSTLYCTTFPCHMCAKHIVSSGISNVIFLEPYPKSLASELHGDSIEIEGQPRGIYSSYPKTLFKHFYGVSPRRYRDLFEKSKRKGKDGKFLPWQDGKKAPLIDIRLNPSYLYYEPSVIDSTLKIQFAKFNVKIEIVIIDKLDER